MEKENKFRFIKVREVKSPTKGHTGDAGIDFYMPIDLTPEQLIKANGGIDDIVVSEDVPENGMGLVKINTDDRGLVKNLVIGPHSRVIIPSGIKGLISPVYSMLQANNKSGISTKRGLVFTAQVVDSNYTGEIHICVANTASTSTTIYPGEKLIQFIHVPVYLTEPEEIPNETFEYEAPTWSSRGSDWQGSTDNN